MTDEEARHRHKQLFGIRMLAVGTAVLGVTIISGRLIDQPAVGYILLVLGAVEFFALPYWLAKQWKNQDK